MQNLLSAVRTGIYAGVIVMEVERLARGNTKDQGIVAEAFALTGTKIITPGKIYDPTNEYDMEYFEFGLFMARREYKTIVRRMQAGRAASAREGLFPGGTAPFGYRKVKLQGRKGFTLEHDEREAPIVRLIGDLYAYDMKDGSGRTVSMGGTRIARYLNGLGHTTRSGRALDRLQRPGGSHERRQLRPRALAASQRGQAPGRRWQHRGKPPGQQGGGHRGQSNL